MKKLVLALTAMAALTAPALAADMAPRYAKAPVAVAPAVSWTGCWISGGGGYGISRTDRYSRDGAAPFGTNVLGATSGSDGWLATAGVGCDYQFSGRWVVGAFVDGTYSDIKGDHAWRVFGPGETFVGENKMDWSWAVGGRIGYLVNPSFLTYFNAGYTQAHTEAYNLREIVAGFGATGLQVPGRTFDGFFVGSGFEYQLDFLPGLFVKTEGRASWYDRGDSSLTCQFAGTRCAGAGVAPFNLANGGNIDSRRLTVYTAKTELVYRFNWGGPVVAKY
jgi:outer membrane immunogenic protein